MMKIRARFWLVMFASAWIALLSGCGGKGETSPAPTGFKVETLDGRVIASWDAVAGVEYWVFYAAAEGVTPNNWTQLPGGKALVNVTSPITLTGLTNGTKYSFNVNGRVSGGPGGPGVASVSATPRLAGNTWAVGTPVAGAEFNALTASSLAVAYVAVGNGGAIQTSPDAATWTARTSGTTNDLYGVATNGTLTVAVGKGGVALNSANAGETWATANSTTTQDLRTVTFGGVGFVAAGAGGVIVASADGVTWATRTSGITTDILGSAFVNNTFVLVGAGGTILTSTDGLTWNNRSVAGAGNFNGANYGAAQFVVVGDGGALYTSADGITFAPQTSGVTQKLNSVFAGSQLVAIGESGTILTSTDAKTWAKINSGVTNSLTGIALRNAAYAIVGRGGVNLTSK
jgi:hypothetical protein